MLHGRLNNIVGCFHKGYCVDVRIAEGVNRLNKEWSEKNKKMQSLIGKKESFDDGIIALLELREDLFGQITSIVNTYPKEAFYLMPFAGTKGYHSKTLGYSLWHIFRIEDIVAHTLISQDS